MALPEAIRDQVDMALLAVIVGLETLKQTPTKVRIYSDSKYVIHAVEREKK